MSLSRDANPSIGTLQVLLDIAQSLQILTNPKALKKAAEDAYALPEQEKKQAESARKDIKKNQEVLAETKALLEEAKRVRIETDTKKLELKRIQDAIDINNSALTKERQKLENDMADNISFRKMLDAREEGISKKERELSDLSQTLELRKQTIEQDEASLKERVAQLRGLTDGM